MNKPIIAKVFRVDHKPTSDKSETDFGSDAGSGVCTSQFTLANSITDAILLSKCTSTCSLWTYYVLMSKRYFDEYFQQFLSTFVDNDDLFKWPYFIVYTDEGKELLVVADSLALASEAAENYLTSESSSDFIREVRGGETTHVYAQVEIISNLKLW